MVGRPGRTPKVAKVPVVAERREQRRKQRPHRRLRSSKAGDERARPGRGPDALRMRPGRVPGLGALPVWGRLRLSGGATS